MEIQLRMFGGMKGIADKRQKQLRSKNSCLLGHVVYSNISLNKKQKTHFNNKKSSNLLMILHSALNAEIPGPVE